jgi:PKD repeat protein
MHTRKSTLLTRARIAAGLCGVVFAAGCTVSKQEAPSLMGPSGFALSMRVTAAPQVLPRDGVSTSAISVTVFNADGTPKPNQRLRLIPDFGTLNLTDVLTGPNGNAIVVFTAPAANENVPQGTATITAVPVDAADLGNTNVGSVRIGLIGPDIPEPSFTISSTSASPAVQDIITFDASATRLGASACGTACSYTWDFGDGSNNIGATTSGMIIQHLYSSSGVFIVTLTVTGPVGTSSSVTKTVTVAPPALPVAAFDPTPASPTAPATVTFDASRSTVGLGATISQYVWTFGDGTPGATTTDPAVSHSYNAAGSFNVTLYVVDSLGRRSATTVVSLTVQ